MVLKKLWKMIKVLVWEL